MITMEQMEKLRQFFGAYFHQDWHAEFGSPERALSAAIRHHDRTSDRQELSRSIVSFVGEHPDDKDLDAALWKELGCEYFPPGNGLSTRSWLLDVAAKLTQPSSG